MTTWYSQKQVMTDPRQKNMMLIMPLVTAFIGWSLPAGVVLYWLTTNALQILQQFAMEYYDKKHPREAPKAVEDKKTTDKASAKAQGEPAGKTQASAQVRKKADSHGQARPGGDKQKPKAGGSSAQKGKAAAQGGGKTSSQVRRPKGPPPPQQKKPQKGSGGKGGSRKR